MVEEEEGGGGGGAASDICQQKSQKEEELPLAFPLLYKPDFMENRKERAVNRMEIDDITQRSKQQINTPLCVFKACSVSAPTRLQPTGSAFCRTEVCGVLRRSAKMSRQALISRWCVFSFFSWFLVPGCSPVPKAETAILRRCQE